MAVPVGQFLALGTICVVRAIHTMPSPLRTLSHGHHLALPVISYLLLPGSADVSRESEVRPHEEGEEAEEAAG